jgi:hypothetical protein
MISKKILWQVGRTVHEFIVEGENLFDVLQEARKIPNQAVIKCGICDKDRLSLFSLIAGDEAYEYVKIKCFDCKATLTLGRPKKEPNTFYIRRKEDKSYDWQPEYVKDMVKRPGEEREIQKKVGKFDDRPFPGDDETPPPSDEDII